MSKSDEIKFNHHEESFFKRYLNSHKVATQKNLNDLEMDVFMSKKEIDKVRANVDKDIDEAIVFANESPYPEPEELLQNVYFEKEAS